jgi:multiple sugar transport system permease protein
MLLLVSVLTTINSIMAFDLFWTITKGGPGSATTVFSWMGYAYAFQFFRFGEGAAILYVLTILCLVLAFIYLKRLFPPVGRGRPLQAALAPGDDGFRRRSLAEELSCWGRRAVPPPGAGSRRSRRVRRKGWLGARQRRWLGRLGLALPWPSSSSGRPAPSSGS